MVKAIASHSGTMQIDFSNAACSAEVNDLDFVITANITEIHRLSTSSPCFRVVITNNSGSLQTSLDLISMFGAQTVLAAPLNLAMSADTDALPVRSHSDPIDIARGAVADISTVHKFGHNPSVGTTYEVISDDGIYNTPQVSGAIALRIAAGDVVDTAAGDGAREVTIQGLDETGALVEEAVATAGTSASSLTTTTWLRVFRAWVSASGTYATSAAGSHDSNIVIETVGSVEWAQITATDFAHSQTQICAYSVPLGYTGFIEDYRITADGTKTIDVALFQRQNILETAPPYTAMRLLEEFRGISGEFEHNGHIPFGPFPALTDIGMFAKGASTPNVACDMEIILIAD
tara:strand:+ start:6578 stop:7618 length:1041 start_codon:yes stop_codon:yes gene_type:complete